MKKLLLTLLLCTTLHAAVSTEISYIRYDGDGLDTTFDFPFGIYNTSDLVVQLINETTGDSDTQIETTEYVVSASNNNYWKTSPGGTVTFVTAPTSSQEVYMYRDPETLQGLNLKKYSKMNQVNPKSLEDVLNKIVTQIQNMQRQINLAIKVPANEGNLDLEVPNAIDRAGYIAGYDSSGLPVALTEISGSSVVGSKWEPMITETETDSERRTWKQDTNQENVRNVLDFGATPNDASDNDATAIQAAIDSLATTGGTVYIPTGVFKVTSTITVAEHRIHIVGNGYGATEIDFEPSAADVCFEFENSDGTGSIDQCSIRDITFWSSDTTYKKTAIHLIDCSYFALRSCGTMYPAWKGADSIFLDINGRDHMTITDMLASADFPIVIGTIDAPHTPSGISIDHSNFNDLYLVGNGNPLVTIETGVLLSQVSFTGRQSWVAGTHGLYWVDTTSAGVSNGLRISNVRSEGVDAVTNNLIYIDHNTTLQGFQFLGGQAGGMKGFYLRNVHNATIDSFYYTGTYEVMNVDATVIRIALINCFWQAASSATMTGQRLLYGVPLNPNTGALPPTAFYDITTNAINYTKTNNISIQELAAASGDLAGYGQYWVKSDTPNIPMFTGDDGTDHEIILQANPTLTGAVIGDATDNVTFSSRGVLSHSITTLSTTDATPTVIAGSMFITADTTTITDFDDGVTGQVITVIAEYSSTITDGTNIFLSGSSNWAMTATDTLTLVCKADNKWYEISRSDNGA